MRVKKESADGIILSPMPSISDTRTSPSIFCHRLNCVSGRVNIETKKKAWRVEKKRGRSRGFENMVGVERGCVQTDILRRMESGPRVGKIRIKLRETLGRERERKEERRKTFVL